ncbi:MAG: F0F1 ATP synthase subunit delta [Candidatus Komeilibacteria bacterium]
MNYTPEQIGNALIHLLADKKGKDIDSEIKKFVSWLHYNKLIYLGPSIIKWLQNQQKIQIKNQTLNIVSAHSLDQEKIHAIKLALQADANTPIKTKLDKKLLGGYIARYNHRALDTSWSQLLDRLRNTLINKSL